jgi:DNA primase
MIPSYFIDELLAKVDLIDVISPYVALKKSGQNWLGLCPFHQEKSPSFSVSQNKQFFHCFGCGEHGDAIGFLVKYQGMTFPEAVEQLSFRYGLTVPKTPNSIGSRLISQAEKEQKEKDLQLMEKISEFYQQQLRQSPQAIEYLKKRGVSGNIAKHFDIGYAPESLQSLLDFVAESINSNVDTMISVLQDLGLANINDHHKPYARFRQRIIFPIKNAKGHTIGFGGRVFLPHQTKEAKYLNSPETALFKKGQEVYGLFEAKRGIAQHQQVIVVEGYLDVITLHQFGFTQSVASMGTALSTEQIQTLLKYQPHLIFAFDGDSAGIKAAERAFKAALPAINDRAQIEFILFTDGKDPDEILHTLGADHMKQILKKALPLSHFWRNLITSQHALDTAEGRTHAISTIKEQWNLLADGQFKQQMTYEIASWIQMPIQDLQHLLTTPTTTHQEQDKKYASQYTESRFSQYKKNDAFNKPIRTSNHHLANIEHRLLIVILAFPQQAMSHQALQDFYRWCDRLDDLPDTLNALLLLGGYLENEGIFDSIALRTRLIENGMSSILDQLPIKAEQWHHLTQHESLKHIQGEEDVSHLLSDLIKGTQRQVIEQKMKWVLNKLSSTTEEVERQQWAQQYRDLTQQYQQHLKSYNIQ